METSTIIFYIIGVIVIIILLATIIPYIVYKSSGYTYPVKTCPNGKQCDCSSYGPGVEPTIGYPGHGCGCGKPIMPVKSGGKYFGQWFPCR